MPERWERELAKLGRLEVDDAATRRRIENGPRGSGGERRSGRLAAGVVAGVVAVAAMGLAWQLLPGGPAGVGEAPTPPPALVVRFHDSEVVQEGPDASYRRVETSIAYGGAVDRSFTSTTSENAIVEWVAAEDLTRFVPGPTAGSHVTFEADGDDPRVLLGRPDDWPNFGRMERIDRLPEEPGEYLLVFVAEYPEGIARTARLVDVVEAGVLQVVLTEGGELFGAEGVAYLDGRGAQGFLSQSSFVAGDVGEQSTREAPDFERDEWLTVPIGTHVLLRGELTSGKIGVFPTFGSFDPTRFHDLNAGTITVGDEAGRSLLAVDATWTRPIEDGFGDDDRSQERALFFFPIEVVDPASQPDPETTSPSPSPDGTVTASPIPSPTAAASDAILVRIEGLGRSERSRESPIMRVTFRGVTALGCTQAFEWTTAAGTKIDEAAGSDGSSLPLCSSEPLFVVPPLTPIVVVSEEGTEVFATRTTTPLYPGIDGFGFSVRWPDGSADFTARYQVRSVDPVAHGIELGCAADDRIEFVTPDGPRILPGGSAYIRGNMAGFLQNDVIEQMTRDPDGSTEWDGTWQVVRDGTVIATVDFSSLGGVACRGSGIGGV